MPCLPRDDALLAAIRTGRLQGTLTLADLSTLCEALQQRGHTARRIADVLDLPCVSRRALGCEPRRRRPQRRERPG